MSQIKVRFATLEYDTARDDLIAWAYHKDLDYYDKPILVVLERGGFGGERVAWMWFEMMRDQAAAMHICVHPEHKGKFWSRHVSDSLVWIMELLGLTKLYALDSANDSVIDYVQRLGWQNDSIGWYMCDG